MENRIEIIRISSDEGEDQIQVRLVHGDQIIQMELSLRDFEAAVTGRSTPCEIEFLGPL